MPSGMRTATDIPLHGIGLITSIPSFAADLFFASLFARALPSLWLRIRSNRSTGSKQTLNGLFICNPDTAHAVCREFTNLIQRCFIADCREFADGYIKSLNFNPLSQRDTERLRL